MIINASGRVLGRTGLAVSPIGIAAFSMARAARRHDAVPPGLQAQDVERAFHEFGVNVFLVHYLMPQIVAGVRRLIRAGLREKLVLVSEVGLPLSGSVRRGLHTHLRALGTDYLDVWLFGWVRAGWHLRPSVWEAMSRLKEDGLARAIGFSSHDRTLAARLGQTLNADVLMIRYNAAHRGAEREVFARFSTNPGERPGIIAYTATRWGMLLRPLPERGFPAAMSAPDCYRFALGHPAVDTVWCAARSYAELSDDIAGVRLGPLASERFDDACRFGDAVHAAATGGRRWMFGRRSD